jgi:hypothetical protein
VQNLLDGIPRSLVNDKTRLLTKEAIESQVFNDEIRWNSQIQKVKEALRS